jgi:hypothetical protein
VLHRKTRIVALVTGVTMHFGIWATMEVGPFTWVMLASYIAFLDPARVARMFRAVPRPAEMQAAS